jgi:hypothetical protein
MGTIRRHISNQLAPGLGITPVSNFVNIYAGLAATIPERQHFDVESISGARFVRL